MTVTAQGVLTIVGGMLPNTFAQDALLAALNTALNDAGKIETTLDITAISDTSRYAITIPPESISRVEVIASGSTTAKEFFYWRAFGGYFYVDGHAPSAGDTIRVYYLDNHPALALTGIVPANIDPQRLAWLTVFHACVARMQITGNTDPTIKDLFQTASQMRGEFMARRHERMHAPTPHYPGW